MDRINAGAGVFCDQFSAYASVGSCASAYDGEVEALRVALTQLFYSQVKQTKFVQLFCLTWYRLPKLLQETYIEKFLLFVEEFRIQLPI